MKLNWVIISTLRTFNMSLQGPGNTSSNIDCKPRKGKL